MQGASHDIWDVNTDFDYHEEQKLDSNLGRERVTMRYPTLKFPSP